MKSKSRRRRRSTRAFRFVCLEPEEQKETPHRSRLNAEQRALMRVQWAMSQVFHRQAGKWQRLAEKTTVFVFVSSRKMRRLNSRFRAKNRPTDVLSFAPTEPNSLGEIVICRDVLRRQAREQGWGPTNELIFVAAHGWLHLLGWDHERSPDEEREMARLQDQIYAWAVDAFPLPRRGAEG